MFYCLTEKEKKKSISQFPPKDRPSFYVKNPIVTTITPKQDTATSPEILPLTATPTSNNHLHVSTNQLHLHRRQRGVPKPKYDRYADSYSLMKACSSFSSPKLGLAFLT